MHKIYYIINKVNGKYYIGQTNDFQKRKNSHLSKLRNNSHHNRYLQNAYNKYGENSFEFVIVHENLTKEEVDNLEIALINELYDTKTLYNLSKKASGGDLISYHPDNLEFREKQRIISKNKWDNSPELKEEYKIKFSGENNPMYGKKHSLETRNKISEILKGRKVSKDVIENLRIKSKEFWSKAESREFASVRNINRYKDINERIKTSKASLKLNIKRRENGELSHYTEKQLDDKYEFMFNGKFYVGIQSCVDDTGYSGDTIKKKLKSHKVIDRFNYIVYDPWGDFKIDNGRFVGVSKHSEETKRKIRESNLESKILDLTVILPNGEEINFKHRFEMEDYLINLGMKRTTIANLLKSGEPWKPKKYIHKYLDGLRIIRN